jgi:hypothetical protein
MTEDQLDEPIDIGDTFEWESALQPGTVEVLNMYVSEDGITQIRVEDYDNEKRTVTKQDVIDQLVAGKLKRRET